MNAQSLIQSQKKIEMKSTGTNEGLAEKSHLSRWKFGGISLVASVLLSACGGGGGSGSSTTSGASSDPTAVEFPIAYVRRPQLAANAPIPDLRNPFSFTPGAKLFVRSRADANATEICVTCSLFPPADDLLYDVKDLDVSPDGRKLIFALHAPMILNALPENQPTWQIWQYDFSTNLATRIIQSNNQAQLGNAVSPHYLTDGRVIYVSDEQKGMRANLLSGNPPAPVYSGLNESGNRKAGVLHVMDSDGLNVSQISYNQSHDLFPWVLKSGKILFSRWDNLGGTDRSLNLYTINPDGSNLSIVYGFHSHDTGTDPAAEVQFAMPREMEDGRVLSILRPFATRSLGGDLIAIDTARFSDNMQPTWQNLGLTGPAQASLAVNTVRTDNQLSPGGQFGAAYPMWDGSNRLIISWAQCFALNAQQQRVPCAVAPQGATPAPPEYGIWVYSPGANATQRPVVTAQAGFIFTDVVAGAPRKNLQVAAGTSVTTDSVFNAAANTVIAAGQGVLDIRSVDNLDNVDSSAAIAAHVDPANAAYKTRNARFLRLIEAVPKPDRQDPDPTPELDNFVFGLSNSMRHIIGYVPIEPDGSVVARVPANVPFTFQIVDAKGKRIGATHDVWWQVGVGEVMRCGGCHNATNTLPHGRLDSSAPNFNPGATLAGSNGGFVVSPLHDPQLKGTASGQNMGEMYALSRNLRAPSLDMKFTLAVDEWATNPAQQNPAFDFSYKIGATTQVPLAPTVASCLGVTSTNCRAVINYLDHIQSIWDKPHPFNATNVTCTSCHNGTNAPTAGHLDLSSTASDRDADRVMSWSDLFTDDVQKDNAGNPLIVNGPQQVDANGNLVFDINGAPVFTQVTVPVGHVMNSGANASQAFFNCFEGAATCGTTGGTTVNHAGMLNGSELRLIAEWLDIGAQYFNDVAKANTASQ